MKKKDFLSEIRTSISKEYSIKKNTFEIYVSFLLSEEYRPRFCLTDSLGVAQLKVYIARLLGYSFSYVSEKPLSIDVTHVEVFNFLQEKVSEVVKDIDYIESQLEKEWSDEGYVALPIMSLQLGLTALKRKCLEKIENYEYVSRNDIQYMRELVVVIDGYKRIISIRKLKIAIEKLEEILNSDYKNEFDHHAVRLQEILNAIKDIEKEVSEDYESQAF